MTKLQEHGEAYHNRLFTIDVLPEDIGKGIEGSTMLCPVALACARAYRSGVSVGGGTLAVDAGSRVFAMAQSLMRWIRAFDLRKAVDPVTILVSDRERVAWIKGDPEYAYLEASC